VHQWPYSRVLDLRSPAHWFNLTFGHCAQMPTQHTIPLGSAYEYQWKIGNKQVHHVMLQPCRDQHRPMGPWGLGRTLLSLLIQTYSLILSPDNREDYVIIFIYLYVFCKVAEKCVMIWTKFLGSKDCGPVMKRLQDETIAFYHLHPRGRGFFSTVCYTIWLNSPSLGRDWFCTVRAALSCHR